MATGVFTDQSTSNLTDQVTWSISNSYIAGIATTGIASATRAGFAVVNAADGSISGSLGLTVLAIPRYLYDLSDAGRDISRLTINSSTGQPRYLGYQTTEATNNLGFPCITTDPSNQYAYVSTQIAGTTSGTYAGQITAYSINPTTGALTMLFGGPYQISQAIGCIQFEPGGNFAYATPGVDETSSDLITLAKDSSGKLSIISSVSLPNVVGGLAMDPRGKFLYALIEVITAGESSAAYGYSIDSTTGALTPIEGTPFDLPNDTAGNFAFSPSGDYLYLANNSSNTITEYSVDRDTGAATAGASISTCENPAAIAFSVNGQYAYVGCDAGILASYSVGGSGQLTQINTVQTSTGTPALTVDPSGQFLYLVNLSNSLSTYKLQPDGSLKLLDQTAGRVEQFNLALLAGTSPVSYNTQFAYLSSIGDNSLSSFSVNSDGTLLAFQTLTAPGPPTGITTLPWGSDLLMATSGTGTNLQAYTVIGSPGSLMGFSSFGNSNTPGGIVIDPSGLTAFNPDSSSGLVYWYGYAGPGLWSTEYASISPLVPATFTAAAGAGPVAMDPSGRYLFVANQTANSISEFQYAGAAPVPDFPLPASPLAICSDANGNYLFVATSDDKLRMLKPGSNSALTDSFDISLPAKPTAIATEPSGHYVYVTTASGLVAFAINQQASTLTGVSLTLSIPLTNATGAYIDPSGQYLYVSVSNSTTGSLYLFTVNSDGTLAAVGSGPVATPRNTTGLVFHAQVQ